MANQLLLIEDVDHLGRKGDVVSAKPGYARNFLLPKGFAVIADRNTLRRREKLQEERAKQAAQDKADSDALASQLQTVTLRTEVKVDQDGHMYGSVSTADVVALMAAQGYTITKKMVNLAHPIRTIGRHTVELNLLESVHASVKLEVIPEGGVLPEETAPVEDQAEEAPVAEEAAE